MPGVVYALHGFGGLLMTTPMISPATVWCVYSHASELRGPLFVKHPGGIALLGFASQAVAEEFIRAWQLPASHEAVLVSQLGSSQVPNHAAWMPETDKVMLISTGAQLRAYAADSAAFVLSSEL